jgi:hypothetical protein
MSLNDQNADQDPKSQEHQRLRAGVHYHNIPFLCHSGHPTAEIPHLLEYI